MSTWDNRVSELEKRLDLVFTQPRLLKAALSHASYENGAYRRDNERLRKLGASALIFYFTAELWVRFPDDSADELSRRRDLLSSNAFLAAGVEEWELHRLILVGNGMEDTLRARSKARSAILAHAVEALTGLVMIERGEVSCREMARGFLTPRIDWTEVLVPDFTRRVQEEAQRIYRQAPDYRVLDRTGAEHDPMFVVGVFLGQTKMGEGRGHSQSDARKKAAANAWDNRQTWPAANDS